MTPINSEGNGEGSKWGVLNKLQVSTPEWYDTVDMHVHGMSVAARRGFESKLETFAFNQSHHFSWAELNLLVIST